MPTAQKNSNNTLFVLSIAMNFSVFIFVVVSFFIPTFSEASVDKIIFYALNGCLIVPVLLIIILPKLFPGSDQPPASHKTTGYKFVGAETQKTRHIFLNFQNPTQRTFNITIMRLSLAESIVIMGFVLALLSHQPILVVPYGMLALILQLIFGPFVGQLVNKDTPTDIYPKFGR